MGIPFFVFFFSRAQDRRQSQRHGAPLLTKNLGNQHTSPANQELGEQEKGWLLLPSQIEGVVQPEAQPPHLAQTTTQKQLLSVFPISNYNPQFDSADPQFNSAPATEQWLAAALDRHPARRTHQLP